MRLMRFFLNYLPYLYIVYFLTAIMLFISSEVISSVVAVQRLGELNLRIEYIFVYPLYIVFFLSAIQTMCNINAIKKDPEMDNEEKSKWTARFCLWFIFANADYYDAFVHDYESELFIKFRKFINLKKVRH